eukprot:m.28957 g.28957  ORF g.28957 m.28957 type:complete len:1150 (+) comp8050_c0_seq1:296-3745(+)
MGRSKFRTAKKTSAKSIDKDIGSEGKKKGETNFWRETSSIVSAAGDLVVDKIGIAGSFITTRLEGILENLEKLGLGDEDESSALQKKVERKQTLRLTCNAGQSIPQVQQVDEVFAGSESAKKLLSYTTFNIVGHTEDEGAAMQSYLKCMLGSQKIADVDMVTDGVPSYSLSDMRLDVFLESARGLVGKDSDGTSDPYCILEIQNVSERRLSIKHRNTIDTTIGQQSECKKSTVNPDWNARFALVLPKDTTWKQSKLCLYMWDRDENINLSIREKTKQLWKNEPDSFLGHAEILLDKISLEPTDFDIKLEKRSSKSRVSGTCQLKLSWTMEQKEIASREALSEYLVVLEAFGKVELSNTNNWDGALSTPATALLQHFIVHNNLTKFQQDVCEWTFIVSLLVKEKFQHNLADVIESFRYTNQELEKASESERNSVLPFFFKGVEELIQYACSKCGGIVSSTTESETENSGEALELYSVILRTLTKLRVSHSTFFQSDSKLATELNANTLNKHLVDTLKASLQDVFKQLQRGASQPNITNDHERKIVEALRLTQLCDKSVASISKSFSKAFKTSVDVDISNLAYVILGKLLLDFMEPRLNIVLKHSQADTLFQEDGLGSVIFELYFAVKKFICQSHSDDLKECNKMFNDLFRPFIGTWIGCSHITGEIWIKKAVTLDQATELADGVQHSSSVVDTSAMLSQMIDLFRQLDTSSSSPEIGMAFRDKLADSMCCMLKIYCSLIINKLEENGYFDTEGRFDVSERLCVTVNNLSVMIERLPLLCQELLSCCPDVQNANNSPSVTFTLFQEVENFYRHKRKQIIGTISTTLGEELNTILTDRISTAESLQSVLDPILDYLDTNLVTICNHMCSDVLVTFLHYMWDQSLGMIEKALIGGYEPKPKFILNREQRKILEDMLKPLCDFFYQDGNGIDKSFLLGTPYYNTVLDLIKLAKTETRLLVAKYYSSLSTMCEKSCYVGKIRFDVKITQDDSQKVFFQISIISGSGLAAHDKNGLSDPYVVLELLPEDNWLSGHNAKTQTVKKSLDPVWKNQDFDIVANSKGIEQSVIRLAVYDADFMSKDDPIGDVAIRAADIKKYTDGGKKTANLELFLQKRDPREKSNKSLFNVFRMMEQRAIEEDEAKEATHKILKFVKDK